MISELRLQELLLNFPKLTIGLVGDLFLDRYLHIEPGVKEISIETDLEAYQVTKVRNSPGALGTVMNNLAALGVGQMLAATVIGDDGHGYDLLNALEALPVDVEPIVTSSDRLTPTYTKPLKQDASGVWQELNRIDVRTRAPLTDEMHDELARNVREMFAKVDGVMVLDQLVERDWGVVDARMRRVLSDLAIKYPRKLIYIDSRAFLNEFEFGILKGNRSEFLKVSSSTASSTEESLRSALAAFALRNERVAFCTLGESGALVACPQQPVEFVPGFAVPPPIDICGAGDAFSSGTFASLLSGASETEAAIVGNLVASITVQQLGTTGTASPEQVISRLREVAG